MFFVLSKLLAFFTQPSNLIVLLGLIGLTLTRTRFARAGWRLAAGSLVLIGLIGFLPLGRALSLPLENRFPPWDATGVTPAGIVVLGGAISADMLATRGEIGINEAAERVVAVPALAKRYPAARIIYSGGDAGLFVHYESEADVVTDLFESLGVPASRLTLEGRSRNTIENAVYSKALAQPKPGERWLLVTSALHMPRAMGAFRQAGFAVEAYPVDYQTNGWRDLLHVSGSLSDGLSRTDNLSGIAIIVACLTVNQLAYVLGVTLANRTSEGAKNSPADHDKASDARGWTNLKQLHGEFDSVPSDNGQSNIAHKHDRNENAPT